MYTTRLHIDIRISSLPNVSIGTWPIANPGCVLAAEVNILSQKSYAHTFSCWKDNFVISRFVPAEVSEVFCNSLFAQIWNILCGLWQRLDRGGLGEYITQIHINHHISLNSMSRRMSHLCNSPTLMLADRLDTQTESKRANISESSVVVVVVTECLLLHFRS